MRAASVDVDFDAVLTGAGISFDAPSILPSSFQLAAEVWDAVRATLPGSIDTDVDAAVRRRLRRVRMEQFLEQLTTRGTIPTAIIVRIYRLVGGVAHNENHLRLAALRVRQFTLNMDVLIEQALPGARVTHLHGVWNRPNTIKTTVSHYSEGVAPRLRRSFIQAIEGKRLLVIGYSGRDTDVMPLIEQHPPCHIVWVSPDPERWEPEVVQLRARYDRKEFGDDYTFEPRGVKAGAYLPELVPTVPQPTAKTTRPPATHLEKTLKAKTTPTQRLLAVATLLYSMGLNAEVVSLLDGHSFRGVPEFRRRRLIARSLDRQGDADAALELLRKRPSRLSEVLPWVGNATQIDEVRRRASKRISSLPFWRLALLVSGMLPLRRFRRTRMLARIRTAKRLEVAGHPRAAARMAHRVTSRKRVHVTLGEDSLVDALTWEAGALKSSGELIQAAEVAERADRLGFYGNWSQAAFAKWRYAEILAAAGPRPRQSSADHRDTIRDLLTKSVVLARLSGDRETLSWIEGTFAEFSALHDIRAARRHLRDAERAGAADETPIPHRRTYHLLQCAAVEVASGDLEAATRHVDDALEAESGQIPPARLQAEQMRDEIRWRRDESFDRRPGLERLADAYHQQELFLNEARARLVLASLRGERVSETVREAARQKGWHDVLRLSDEPVSSLETIAGILI